ncbi:MAG: STAS domain-containing protein [Victivallaceae bacterium]|nr:STAS domain-containing protein [Victivallaceae bacterium]
MDLKSYERDGVLVIQIDGRLDAEFAETLRSEFLKQIANHRRFVLDLAGMEYLDSTGLGAIVFCLKSSNEYNGKLALANLGSKPRMIFTITRAYKIFDIYDDLDSAIKAVKA